ncbi:hypothetical protein HK101_008124 [Irineochytrium annulatum]|nr:hypothetical protein HK101_008124 [Irineochytrium annulatum]
MNPVVRDFGFPPADPRHWGGTLTSKPPTKSLSSLNSNSNSRAHSLSHLSESAAIEQPKDLSDDGGDPDSRKDGQTSVSDDMDTGDEDEEDRSISDPDQKMLKDAIGPYLSRIASEILSPISSTSLGSPLQLHRRKVLYDFWKVTEWEMSISAGEIVVVAIPEGATQPSPMKGIDRPSHDAPKTKEEEKGSLDRWGSIEEDDDGGLASTSEAKAEGGGEPAAALAGPITLEPDPSDFVAQIKEFIDYQPVYGTGWVTAFKVTMSVCKNRRKRAKKDEDGVEDSATDDSVKESKPTGPSADDAGTNDGQPWQAVYDEESKSYYWWNTTTGETTWDDPNEVLAKSEAEPSTANDREPAAANGAPADAPTNAHADYYNSKEYMEWYYSQMAASSAAGAGDVPPGTYAITAAYGAVPAAGNGLAAGATTSAEGFNPAADYSLSATFNQKTGRFQPDRFASNAESYFNPNAKAERQMAHFFDIDRYQEERNMMRMQEMMDPNRNKKVKLTKRDLEKFKKKNKEKKLRSLLKRFGPDD